MINTIATTSLGSTPQGSFTSPEGKGFDPYADLFAALFTFPAPVQPEPLTVDEPVLSEGEEPLDPANKRVPDDLMSVPLLPEAAKPEKVNSQDILGLFPKAVEPIARDNKTAIPDATQASFEQKPQIEFFGPPIKQPSLKGQMGPKAGSIGRDEGLEIKVDDVCGLPVSFPDAKVSSQVGAADSLTVNPVIDQPRFDLDDRPDPIEPLELPTAQPVMTSTDKQEVILEITPSHVSTLEVISVEAFPPTQVKTPIGRPLVLNEKLPKTFPVPEPKQHDKVSLLETFTTNVLFENREQLTPIRHSPMKAEVDIDSTFVEPLNPIEEPTKAEQPTEFSFGSSLNGNKGLEQIEKPITSEFKLKRIILDQVGSAFTDLALGQKDTGEKRTLKIRLSPAELGTVEITLAKNADGMIDAHFQTDNPKTQHVLQESLAQLRESLERSGIQVGNLNTSCTSFSSGGHDGSDARRREFTNADDQTGKRPAFDPGQKSEDDKQSRLVNLRA